MGSDTMLSDGIGKGGEEDFAETDGLMAGEAYDALVLNTEKQGFEFDFDFTAHSSWDNSVTVEEFNQLVNEAANMVGGIRKNGFKEAVANMEGYSDNVKQMVLLFVDTKNARSSQNSQGG